MICVSDDSKKSRKMRYSKKMNTKSALIKIESVWRFFKSARPVFMEALKGHRQRDNYCNRRLKIVAKMRNLHSSQDKYLQITETFQVNDSCLS